MQEIVNYFENIPSLHRSILLIGGIALFWFLEGFFPLVQFNYRKWRHAFPNFFFTLTTIVINFALAFLLLNTSDWTVENAFGILQWFPNLPLWAEVILGVLLLDFVGAYLPHYTEHQIKPLWMIHLVHHSDPNVDTTTANRHHPLESIVRFGFTLAGVFLLGTSIGIIMLYQALSVVSTQFNHANIKLPKKIDRCISYFLVSPDMHKIHHHYRLPYTDTNFGNIFSLWDRLLGTFSYYEREKIVYGVDVFPDVEKNTKIESLLRQPFEKYQRPTMDRSN
ncbi:MAG: sterol desaturase family protein [Flavobacteriaceae bacterium]|jgi:sterol desaturase/sphingolipid hydroxylase (fatty acid hydroxylase superfamily)|nr:sterol desaturase family protein [Flavobacteriaceae bacterium]MDG1965574.1 sterol desaturase family protein [Flavobacteriaceae bacterium]